MTPAEIDALVAEKVMGAPKHVWNANLGLEGILYDYEGCEVCRTSRRPDRENEICVRAYSTDIAAAWQVVEKLCLSVDVAGSQKPTGYWVGFHSDRGCMVADMENESVAFAETAPLAICLAALKAVSIKSKVAGQ